MKFHFEPDLDFQREAIDAVCDLFHGQEISRSEFTVEASCDDAQQRMAFAADDLGVGNKLKLLDDEVLENLKKIQASNGIKPSASLSGGDFTVEMETGTGKTYVYLRTLFELNQRYGFSKFIIVVPSVAIKEGVYKSIEMMAEHFRGLYANEPFEYFIYDGKDPSNVRNFATSSQIQIMIMTVGAINKAETNNIYKPNEKLSGETPCDLIKQTAPVLIIDEPQSVDGGANGKGKDALEKMKPLCTLRYSATHVDEHHMVYRLGPVDAYERKLVKQIEIASANLSGGHNRPYVKLISVHNRRNSISAVLELDIESNGRVKRETKPVVDTDLLSFLTGRDMYDDYRVGEISVEQGNQYLELHTPGDVVYLEIGQAINEVDPHAIKREMIKRTILEHLEKEMRFNKDGVKVLSLFFIDKVENYRTDADEDDTATGIYATIFEEEYQKLAKQPKYKTLFNDVDVETEARDVHKGYFSKDTKGKSKDTSGKTKADESTYNLIMKDKEKLLSFDTKLKFIFSHSALREGWDNPNVFQICSLREMGTENERRQTIGRGLRLCRDQEGKLIRGFGINTLTVIATEGYEEFAENLQKEYEKQTGIRFGIVEQHEFLSVVTVNEHEQQQNLNMEQSQAIWNHLKSKGYLNDKGKIQDTLRTALKEKTVDLPKEFSSPEDQHQILEILRKRAGNLNIKDAADRTQIRTNSKVLHSEEFKALWDRVKHKTTYRLNFDDDELIAECAKAIKGLPPINVTTLQWQKSGLTIGKSGIDAGEAKKSGFHAISEGDIPLPDILTELERRTYLTRRSIVDILKTSERLNDFLKNPQQFIEQSAEVIMKCKRLAIVDGIKYQKLGDDHYYAQELFEQEELMSHMKNAIEAKRSVYEYVIYDSVGVEKEFANQLETNEAIKVYAKLPAWFKIPTPLGSYNPDWAILLEKDGEERLYFVVETKSHLFKGDLRNAEGAKIQCGEEHFKALEEMSKLDKPAKYHVARNLDDVLSSAVD